MKNERLELALRYVAQDGYASARVIEAIGEALDHAGTSTYETCAYFAERMKKATDPRAVHRQLVDDAQAALRKLEASAQAKQS